MGSWSVLYEVKGEFLNTPTSPTIPTFLGEAESGPGGPVKTEPALVKRRHVYRLPLPVGPVVRPTFPCGMGTDGARNSRARNAPEPRGNPRHNSQNHVIPARDAEESPGKSNNAPVGVTVSRRWR